MTSTIEHGEELQMKGEYKSAMEIFNQVKLKLESGKNCNLRIFVKNVIC